MDAHTFAADPLAVRIFKHASGVAELQDQEWRAVLAEAISLGRLDIFKMADEDGLTCLMWAALRSHSRLASVLAPLSDANAKCSMGMTALRLALDEGSLNCAELLLPLTDVRLCDKQGISQHAAIQYNQIFSGVEIDALLAMHGRRLVALNAFDERTSIDQATPASLPAPRRISRI